MTTIKAILILTILSVSCIAQTKSTKRLEEEINWLDFFVVKIERYVERYQGNEINVIYYNAYGENKMKIHSILKSNYAAEKQIDTTFFLSETQQNIVDKFRKDFKNNQIKPTSIVYAGTRTFFHVTQNDTTKTIDNKSDYSLILDLIKN